MRWREHIGLRRLKRRTSRIAAGLLMLVCGAGCWRAAPGSDVNVDATGHRLHMRVVGESGPVVVLESGLPEGIKGWRAVQEGAGRFAKVIAYERAGSGQSEPGPLPRDAKEIAAELHAALHNGGFAPPYVLVGHSMGGPYVRVFAAAYPKEVCGMVLVDPTQADSYESMEELKGWFGSHYPAEWERVEAICGKMPAGFENLQWMWASSAKEMEEYVGSLPRSRGEAMRRKWWDAVESAPMRMPEKMSVGARGEFAAATDSFQEAMAARPLPEIPIVLLSAAPATGFLEAAAELNPDARAFRKEMRRRKLETDQKWVAATQGAKLVVAEGSGHGIPEEDPELVVKTIRSVLPGG